MYSYRAFSRTSRAWMELESGEALWYSGILDGGGQTLQFQQCTQPIQSRTLTVTNEGSSRRDAECSLFLVCTHLQGLSPSPLPPSPMPWSVARAGFTLYHAWPYPVHAHFSASTFRDLATYLPVIDYSSLYATVLAVIVFLLNPTNSPQRYPPPQSPPH